MIDSDIIDSLDESTRKAVVSALSLIGNSGIIEAQKDRNFATVLAGADNESEDELAKKILAHRRSNVALMTLQLLCDSMQGEIK